jgi:hypothetical protein
MRELIQQYTNHPEQDKRGRRRYRDSVHWGAVAKVRPLTRTLHSDRNVVAFSPH